MAPPALEEAILVAYGAMPAASIVLLELEALPEFVKFNDVNV
jgi:hypothetical protein